jgi:hypothetical protein
VGENAVTEKISRYYASKKAKSVKKASVQQEFF